MEWTCELDKIPPEKSYLQSQHLEKKMATLPSVILLMNDENRKYSTDESKYFEQKIAFLPPLATSFDVLLRDRS